jgi:uncharacterized membrane protein HdeD (DUF308 family)
MNDAEKQLATILSRSWWVLLLRGLVAIAFGVVGWLQPGISLAALLLLFGAYSLADGVLHVWSAVAGRHEHEHWWVMLLGGLVGIGVGVVTFVAPGVTALALVLYIAIWAIATGVLGIATAIRLRKEIEGEWLLILAGAVTVAFGVMLMVQPGAGALSLLWPIATYAVFFGACSSCCSRSRRGASGLGREALDRLPAARGLRSGGSGRPAGSARVHRTAALRPGSGRARRHRPLRLAHECEAGRAADVGAREPERGRAPAGLVARGGHRVGRSHLPRGVLARGDHRARRGAAGGADRLLIAAGGGK